MVADAMASTVTTTDGTIAVMTIIAMGIATMAGAGIVRRRLRIAIITMRIRRTTTGRLRRRRIVGIGIGETRRHIGRLPTYFDRWVVQLLPREGVELEAGCHSSL